MTVRRFVLAIAVAIVPGLVQAQTFNTLYEYGNAAQSSQTSGAGKARGADFSQSASGKYTITAGGTDFWDVSDHGSAIFDKNAAPVTGDFSAIAKVSIGLQGETMPDEWGRTGIMARTTPSEANSAYFAATQKFNGAPDATNRRQALLQFRDAKGAGTDRVSDGQQTTLKTGQAGGAVPVWLGLHRFGNQIFQTWAPDVNGAPGAWSVASGRVGSEAHAGPVQLGLFHQNHNVQPQTSTASFSDFKNTNFNNALGDFPLVATRNVGLGAGNKVTGNFGGVEVGGGPKQAVDWKVEVLGAPTVVPGLLARSYLRGNSGSNFDPDALPVRGEGVIPQIAWFGNTNPAPAGFEKYYDVFGLPADTNQPADNQENYSVDAKGQIFIPEAGTYKFKDGVDDYTYLSIDGEKLIDDNDWTGPAGNDNGGSPIVSKTFAASGWYDINFKMAEGGGGDSGMLYWDYKNDGFPAKKDTAAKTNALVPAANFRTVARAVLDTLSGKSIQDGILKDANGKTLTVAPGTDVRVTVNGATSVEKLVPEPASMTLALLSAFGLLGVARRRR